MAALKLWVQLLPYLKSSQMEMIPIPFNPVQMSSALPAYGLAYTPLLKTKQT